jgi:hypothetical protein
LVPCIYEEKEHRRLVKELVDNFPSQDMLSDLERIPESLKDFFGFSLTFSDFVLFLAPLIKSASFKEEKEWRLITPALSITGAKFRKGNYSLIPYWEFDLDIRNTLKAVFIGPTPEPILSEFAVRDLLTSERFIDRSGEIPVPFFANTMISPSKPPSEKFS